MFLFLLIVVGDVISDFPSNFDLRLKYPYCPTISSPMDQKECGSCWAFSTTSATSDRLCIQGWTTLTMAPEHPIQCDSKNTGCDGGFVGTAFDYHNKDGLVTEDCKAYMNEAPRTCSKKCDNKETITPNMLYRTEGKVKLSTIEKIKDAIYNRGSVVGSYMVYDSFNSFYPDSVLSTKDKNAVFRPENISGEKVTFHAVKFVGWGIDSAGLEYWLIQNSWGNSWADSGYFRIEMNKNTAQIEEDVWEANVALYIDRCSNNVDCDSCNAVTELPKPDNTGFEPGHCGFCQATDQCIEVNMESKTMHDAHNESNTYEVEVKTPIRGVCPDIATSVCPLDDCLQMSNDPYRCVQHSGCGYCASTRKCRKGNVEKQNVGRCNNWLKTAVKVPLGHQNCTGSVLNIDGDFARGKACVGYTLSTCGYCLSSSLCLSANQFLPSVTELGRCDAAYWWYAGEKNLSDPIAVMKNLSSSCDYSTKERCDVELGCKWDAALSPKKCIKAASVRPLNNDSVCLGEKCDECNAKPGCRYCTSTQSCLSFGDGVGKGGDTTHTTCSLLSELDASPSELCNECGRHPSCYACALQAECGWWEQLGLCMAGRLQGPFDPAVRYADENSTMYRYRRDTFTSFKMRCPFVLEYTYTAGDAAVHVHVPGRALPSIVRLLLLLWAVVGFTGVWAVVF